MHLQTHLMASWAIGSGLAERRDRRLVAWAGVVSDLDGLSLLWGLEAYVRWHHVLTHGLIAAAGTALVVWAGARDRLRAALLAFVGFHSHLVLDLAGSGSGWTIHYLFPSRALEVGVDWAWELSSWQNLVATMIFLAWSLRAAVVRERSFVESWAPAAVDLAFCGLVRRAWRRLRPGDGVAAQP